MGSFFNWAGLALGLLGVILSWIFYRRSKRVFRLRQLTGSATLIGEAAQSPGLEVRFVGQKVDRLTTTSVALWNDGTETLRGEDIVESDRLRFELSGEGEILDASIESFTRPVSGFQVKMASDKIVEVTFDYLDPGDGMRARILHTGTTHSVRAVGSIRGMPQGLSPYGQQSVPSWIELTVFWTIMAVCAVMALLFFAVGVTVIHRAPWPKNLTLALSYIGLLGVMVFSVRAGRRAAERADEVPRVNGMPDALQNDRVLTGLGLGGNER